MDAAVAAAAAAAAGAAVAAAAAESQPTPDCLRCVALSNRNDVAPTVEG